MKHNMKIVQWNEKLMKSDQPAMKSNMKNVWQNEKLE